MTNSTTTSTYTSSLPALDHDLRQALGPLSLKDRDKAAKIIDIRTTGSSRALQIPTGLENIRALAETLEYAEWERQRARKSKRASRFQMNVWVAGMIRKTEVGPPPFTCGTSACLAGTAAAFALKVGEKMDFQGVYDAAGKFVSRVDFAGRMALGLNPDQAGALFYLTDERLDTIKLVASYIAGYDFQQVGR